MKRRRPGQGAAREDDRLKRGSGELNLFDQLPSRNPIALTPWSAWCDSDLDDSTRTDLRRIWWKFRPEGQTLPAKPGVILLYGGGDE